MHVPSYPRVVALLLVLASFAGSAQAVEFDEKLKAPMVKDAAVLRTQAQSYAEKFTALQAASPQEFITQPRVGGGTLRSHLADPAGDRSATPAG